MTRLIMTPATGERRLRYVGDCISFQLLWEDGRSLPSGWRAFLRTNLGRAATLRREIIESHFRKLPLAGESWRDVAMPADQNMWTLNLALAEVGFFWAKAYAVDPQGRQHWPHGPDIGITVHPDSYRTGNTVYCAFVRLFGQNRATPNTRDERLEAQMNRLDKLDYTVIPPSGKLRDLIGQLPHIIDTLGCRIIHLLPINPTPTTRARFGRFGSPYAAQDLLGIDPALVVHENSTTGVDQFRELTQAVHLKGGRVFLDLAINHTGWGSTLQEYHPEWFVRDEKGEFVSPGAWGVTWGDLVELEHKHPALWDYLSNVFLEWCRRGVDGFRCDAGYKVPMRAWQFIIARVREEFPETLFLLEGLGGAWELTENLLTEGGMQWAYSELFQNYTGIQVGSYLDHSLRQSERVGLLIHYSETHDNPRLAARNRAWSLLRNRLCALTSVSGGFGFTCGVEWLAREKIFVHQANGLAWGNPDNLLAELSLLNQLLTSHPCFFDGAKLVRLSEVNSPVLALRRDSADGENSILVLANVDPEAAHLFSLSKSTYKALGQPALDLLGQKVPSTKETPEGEIIFELEPAAVYALSAKPAPPALIGDHYRSKRALAAWAVTQAQAVLPMEKIGPFQWESLEDFVSTQPEVFLTALTHLSLEEAARDFVLALRATAQTTRYPLVSVWQWADRTRILPIPPEHWLVIRDEQPIQARLQFAPHLPEVYLNSIATAEGHLVSLPPRKHSGDARLTVQRFGAHVEQAQASLRFLKATPDLSGMHLAAGDDRAQAALERSLVLLTNGLGGMARLGVDLGGIVSKYDCALGANLHPTLPVDRHIFVKRLRAWVNAAGFITPLRAQNLVEFTPAPPARWRFVANAGDGRSVEIHLTADMLELRNTTVFRFHRPEVAPLYGKELGAEHEVSLVVRVDLEDRNFHSETHLNEAAAQHFRLHCRPLSGRTGFEFTPATERQLVVVANRGKYHHEEESTHSAHPVEASRGQTAHGDAFSPGWFELPLAKGTNIDLTMTADTNQPTELELTDFPQHRTAAEALALSRANLEPHDRLGRQLVLATRTFVVRREEGKTVMAGYPWFLDWGRDSLICARGLLAAGMIEEVRQMLLLFGRYEENGTLPNTIHGNNISNRDTSDAPLWFGMVCEEAASLMSDNLYEMSVDLTGRTVREVLLNIATGYLRGTPNGIRVDPDSGLVWSPSHFTWMDTNYPAGTPREGYPIEIQALWIRFLRQLSRVDASPSSPWSELAGRAEKSLQQLFWLEEPGYFADVLLAPRGTPARQATPDTALRSNGLLAISLGLVNGSRAQRTVLAARNHLLVPGALRSLAPLRVAPPLPIRSQDGLLLNDPDFPYQGRYEGDEDTRRKPAYHNGTAWTWTFPSFCEALARAWNFTPEAVRAARAYLGSVEPLLEQGCLGQLPEIVDGDAPHAQRGCDAQAWGATEALRVWKLLHSEHAATGGDRSKPA